MKKFLSFCSIVFIFSAVPCLADLYNCKGTWTNKPCDGSNKIPEKKETPDNKDKSKKESILHDLRMLVIKAKREHDIRYNIEVIEDLCKNSNLEDCDKSVKTAQKELQTQVTDADEAKERNALIREANKLKKERNRIEENKPPVIIQQNTVIVPRRPLWQNDRFRDASNNGQNSSLRIDVR